MQLLLAESGRRYILAALLLSDKADDVWCDMSPALLVAREEDDPAERWSILPRVVLRSEGDRGEASASSTAALAGVPFPAAAAAAAAAPNTNSRSTRLSKGLLSLTADPRYSGGYRRPIAAAVFGRCLAAGGRGGERLAGRGWRAFR